MANQTVYPYGTGGSLPASIGIINDRTTGGADKAWSAEQGKLACQDIDKNTKDIFEMFATAINSNSYTEQVGWTIIGTNKWQHVVDTLTMNNYGCILIPITPGKRYRVYGNTTATITALLASDSMVAGASPDFCTGYNGRIAVAEGAVYDFIAPEDAAYLYLLRRSSGNEKDGYVRYSDADIANVGVKLGELQGSIDVINSQRIGDDVPVTDHWVLSRATGIWSYAGSANIQQCYLIPITPGNEYRVLGGTTGSTFALLQSDTKTAGQVADFCQSEPGVRFVDAGHSYNFTAPSDAAYFYLSAKTSSGVKDAYLAIPKSINEVIEEGGIGTVAVDGFANPPERFGWLKLQQASQIKWTPKKGTIQQASRTTMFPADTEQQGIPYSSLAEYDKRIGFDVSFHTFMTALNNPYSVMYTECVRYGYSRSAYGRQYYGPDNSGPFYGMVCSNYISYALGTIPYITGDLVRLVEAGIMEVVYDQSANGVKRFDILWQTGHVRVVKDVWRKSGIPTKILVSEERQPIIIDNAVMTSEQFNAFLAQNNIIIYRYKELFKNINYEPLPYIAVGDEVQQEVTYNNDICTFYGDKVAFIEGELIYIHCLDLAYPQMELYKNDTLLMTITLASDSRAAKTSDELAWAVNLSNDGLTYGKYKCRLKNGSTYSDYTYFEVINAQVTVDGDTATYSSANANAVAWYWSEYHSTDGQGMHNITPLPGAKTGTIDVSNRHTNYKLLKVLFRGEYGNVAATFLES